MKSRHAAALASKDAKAVTAGALLGLLIPVGVHLTMHLYPLGNWILWLWPSLVLLLVFGVPAPVADMRLIFAISVGINIVLYAVLAWFAMMVFDTAKRL